MLILLGRRVVAAGLLIVASKYAIAHDFAIERRLNFSAWTYVDRGEKLRGLYGHKIIFLDDWRKLPEADKIREMVQVMRLIEVVK